MFEIKLIQTFATVARFKSFVKAADFLNMTQPGVSQHIAKLEEQMGTRLIARSRKGAELTAAGDILLRHSKRMFGMFDRVLEECRDASGGLIHIVIGLSSSSIYSAVPARISHYARANSDLDISLRVIGGDELMNQLDWGELDMIITTLPASGDQYHCVEIGEQRMGVALPSGHALLERSTIALTDIVEESFIVVPREHHPINHDALRSRFEEIGAALKVASYDTAFPNVLARVAMGEGAALVALGYGGDDGSFRIVPLDDPILARTPIYAIALKDQALEPVVRLINRIGEPAAAPRLPLS